MRLLTIFFCLISFNAFAQKDPQAKVLYEQAKADTAAKRDSIAAINFYKAAILESKHPSADLDFVAQTLAVSGAVAHYKANMFAKANDYYSQALTAARKAKKQELIFELMRTIGTLYEAAQESYEDLTFPITPDKETIITHFPITVKPVLGKSGTKYFIAFGGGSNDGVYMGSVGKIWSTAKEGMASRNHIQLGSLTINKVYANFTIGVAEIFNASDSFRMAMIGDLVEIPVRANKKPDANIIDEISLYNIRLLTNDKKYVVHPRMVLHNTSPELYTDVYAYLLTICKEIWDQFKNATDEGFVGKIKEGRYKGKNLLEVFRDTKQKDILAFLGYMSSYSDSYMGLDSRFSELYASWILGNAPPGAVEVMDSLLHYKKNPPLFNTYLNTHKTRIMESHFTRWLESSQNDARLERKFALNWTAMMMQVSNTLKNDSLLGWANWISAYSLTKVEERDRAVDHYKKSIELFKKTNNPLGLSYAINNIGSLLSDQYKYKEAQAYFAETLELRKKRILTDTFENAKVDLGSAYLNVGTMLAKQGDNKAALGYYMSSLSNLVNIYSLAGKKRLADVYTEIAKSYRELADYENAAKYYDLEFTVRKALGDDEAMADAYDYKAYLLSLMGKNRESLTTYQEAYTLHTAAGQITDAGFSMSNVAQMLWTLGNFDSAIIAHKLAIKLREDGGDKKGQAYSWNKLGQLYSASGDPVQSLQSFNKSLALYKEENAEPEIAALYKEFANNYKNVKDNATAAKYYSDALSIYRKIKSKKDIGSVYSDLSSLYYNDFQFKRSEQYIDSAIIAQLEIEDKDGLIFSYLQKGNLVNNFRSDLKSALKYNHLALMLSEKTTSESNIAFSQNALGSLHESLANYDSARYYHDKALKLYRKLEDKKNEADVLVNKGYYFSNLALYDSARHYFLQGEAIAKTTDDARLQANILDGIAHLESITGHFDSAFTLQRRILDIWIKQNNPWGIAGAHISLGNTHNLRSEFKESLRNYRIADSMFAVLDIQRSRATAMNNIGTIYFFQKNYEQALKEFKKALNILEKTNEDLRFIALVKSNIGEVYTGMNKYPEAEKWLNESIDLGKSIKNKERVREPSLILAKLKSTTGNYTMANQLFEQVIAGIDKNTEKLSLIQAEAEYGRSLVLQKAYTKAENLLFDAVILSLRLGHKTHVWKAYTSMADIKIAKDSVNEAIELLAKAIVIIEELKARISGNEEDQKSFSKDEEIVDIYLKIAKYLKQLGRHDEALAYLEKLNIANINLRFSAGGSGDVKENDDIAKAKQKQIEFEKISLEKVKELAKPAAEQNTEKIARLEQMNTIAEKDYQQFITELAKKYPSRSDLQQIDPRQFRQERKFIPADVVLLSYLVTNKELSIFIVTKDTLLVKDIPINKVLFEKKITLLYNAYSKPNGKIVRGVDEEINQANLPANPLELNMELYDLLIKPAMSAIAGKKRVAIVPNSLLTLLPFQALAFKDAAGTLKYFGESMQVFYVNKITTVTNGRNQLLNDLKILAAGNADRSLENAGIEVKDLQQQFPSAKIFTGNAATKKNVLDTKGDFNVLHLATHGVLNYSEADSSYLVFAVDKTTGDDGRLRISDINKMTDLDRFNMVTLSACETAVIQQILEGWPVSTATAFLEAGVPTVIASLWKVDDKATSMLMQRFYGNMKTMDKVAALQEAQSYVRNQAGYSDPFYWAPFQLVGLWQ